MILSSSEIGGWWIFAIVAIFALIGVVVFVLRKKIPGLAEYEKEDEKKIAEDNLARILVDIDEDETNNLKKEEEKETKSDDKED